MRASAGGERSARPGDVHRARVLERLAAGPSRIAAAARRAAGQESVPRPGAGWTAREVVGHLYLVEQVVFHARLDQLAAGESPRWAWVEPGTAAAGDAPTLDDALDLFAARRAGTLGRVAAFDEPGWNRTGMHATFGRLDVVGLLGVIADHDDEHHADLEARLG
jgi:hypothetical protein